MKNKLTALILLILFTSGVSFAQVPAGASTGIALNTTYTVPPAAAGLVDGVTYDMYLLNSLGNVVIGTNADFVYSNGAGNVLPTIAGTVNNTTYQWGVWADGTVDPTLVAPLYGPFTFTTVLATPSLTGPANAATGQSITPSLSWTLDASTSNVQYYIDYDPDGAAPWANTVGPFAASPQVLPALSYNTSYGWQVRAVVTAGPPNVGETTTSGIRTFTTILGPPTAQLASLHTTTSFQANWTAHINGGATSYRLDVGTTPGGTQILNDQNVGLALNYSVTGLVAGTTYYYKVRAVNAGGTSISSGEITTATIPPAPVAIVASNLNILSFDANWNATAGATSYRLDVAVDAGFTSFVINDLNVGLVTTFGVNVASAGTYYYRVRAVNGSGTSANSNTISTSVPPPPVATAASSITQTSFAANWNAATGATAYYLDVSTSNAFGSFVTGYNNLLVNNVLTYNVIGLANGTTYYYRIRAYNPTGTSVSSNTITVVTLPGVPVATAATAITQTTFSANWNVVPGATGYFLDVDDDINFGSLHLANQPVAGITFPVVGLTPGTTYYYRVRSNGPSANSNVITVLTIPFDPTPNAATNVSGTSFTANWTGFPITTGYFLDVATDAGFTAFVTGYNNLNVGLVTTYNVTGLSANTNYWYRVRAYNGSGTSGNTGFTTLTTGPLATAATLLSQTTFQANWNAVGGAITYFLDVSTTSNFGSFVPGYNNLNVGNVTTFPVIGLVEGTTYYYRFRSNVVVTNSNTITALTVAPNPVATAATNVAGTSFSANWNAALSATGYYLDVATDAGFTTFVTGFNNLAIGNVTTYTVTGLTPATNYWYRVRAFNASGTSNHSNVTPTTTGPVVPTIVGVSPANYAVGVSVLPSFAWGGGTNYEFQIDNDSDFSSPVATYTGAGTTYDFTYLTTASTVLANGTVYYWRVRKTGPPNSDWVTREFTTVNAATPAITHTSVSGTSATLYWYPVPFTTGLTYDLLYSTNANMTGFTTVPGITATNHTLSGLTLATTYYVQILAKTNSGTVSIGYSTVVNFLIPGLPVPIPSYPTAGVTSYLNPTTLYWYTGTFTTGLEFEVRYGTSNVDTTPADGMMDAGTTMAVTTNLFKTLPTLTAGTTYYWQVRTKSGSSYSAWSTIESFVIYSAAPLSAVQPILSWPVGGATVYTSQPSFYWYLGTYSTGLEFYFEYDDASNFATPLGNSGWITNQYYSLTTNLTGGSTYYWRVRSRLAATPATLSAWSTTESFVVANTASGLAAPLPTSPVGGTTVGSPLAGTLLSWSASGSGTLEYEVKISPYSSVDGSGILNHPTVATKTWATGTSTTTAGFAPAITLVAGATYYWQVRARLQATPTTVSAWSYVATFSTAAGSFAVVPLIGSPNYGQPINNNSAVLSWVIPTISASPLTYDVEYSKNKDMSNSIVVKNVEKPSLPISGLQSATTYYWRALSKTSSGSVSSYSEVGSFKTSGGVTSVNTDEIPNSFELAQNYPNPFNPTTLISYSLPKGAFVTLKVYDMLGKEVKTLVSKEVAAGKYSVEWSGDDNFGNKVSTGAYVYRVTAGDFVSVKKMLLIK